jgi:ABC-type bacteriocin/lantibiotic exporter with double-glycine peptidase domain
MAYSFTPIIAIGGHIFGQASTVSLTPVKAFTTLAIAALIVNPYTTAVSAFRKVHSAAACFDRIGAFLLSKNSCGRKEVPISDDLPGEAAIQPDEDVAALMFDGAHVAPSAHSAPIFHNLNFSIRRSRITAILGPVGSGKTTLLRSMLGEAPARYGQVLRQAGDVAYCGQQPWLRNASIRKNIVGRRSYDPVWYEVVLNACALNEDLQRLPLRDSYVVGTNGANLSGGQKHRVVSIYLYWLRCR